MYAALVRWVIYVARSTKARAMFVHEPRDTSLMGRLMIGLVAIALIVWPFVLNEFVEATVYLARCVNPKDTSAGSGLGQGVLAVSVAIGLFVLMKNVLSMRNVWIAVLLPVCYAALFFLYAVRGFSLYFRF